MHPKRQKILEAVIDFLASVDNEEKLTLSNVAKKCNIGKSTLYEYFKNKTEMVEESIIWMMEQEVNKLLEPLNVRLSFKETLMEHLTRLKELTAGKHQLNEIANHPEVSILPKENKYRIMEQMQRLFKLSEQRLQDVLAVGINEGVIKKPENKARKNTISALIFGAVIAVSQPFNDWDLDETFEDLYQSIISLHK